MLSDWILELNGLDNTKSIAKEGTLQSGGVCVWKDRRYSFESLPQYLKGIYYFQTPINSSFTNVSISTNRAATMYFAVESTNSPLVNKLRDSGWCSVSGKVMIALFRVFTLDTILSKQISTPNNGPAIINLPNTTTGGSHFIFVKGVFIIILLLFLNTVLNVIPNVRYPFDIIKDNKIICYFSYCR